MEIKIETDEVRRWLVHHFRWLVFAAIVLAAGKIDLVLYRMAEAAADPARARFPNDGGMVVWLVIHLLALVLVACITMMSIYDSRNPRHRRDDTGPR